MLIKIQFNNTKIVKYYFYLKLIDNLRIYILIIFKYIILLSITIIFYFKIICTDHLNVIIVEHFCIFE